MDEEMKTKLTKLFNIVENSKVFQSEYVQIRNIQEKDIKQFHKEYFIDDILPYNDDEEIKDDIWEYLVVNSFYRDFETQEEMEADELADRELS